ncbi:DUF6090 family protein [Balneola sp. MJW-20]|uniref:DUF6090 family protein n=1 Tax=Gracilimonas aurantiaca TaxID=3234185 RepID=UPI0034654104
MVTLFRRIREKLIASGSVTKYLLYAAGEILLVVIGILIALQVNNWNEERKNEATIRMIFSEIQQDLLNDIREFDSGIDWYVDQDTLASRMIRGEFSKQNFLNTKNRNMFQAGLNNYVLVQSDRSYELLTEYKDILPANYREVMIQLNSLYEEDQSFLNTIQGQLVDVSTEYLEYTSKEFEWSVDLAEDNITEDVAEYFANSTYHKQRLALWRNRLRNLLTIAYRIKEKSVINYLIIRNVTGDQTRLPELIQEYGISDEPLEANYDGKFYYKNEDGDRIPFALEQEYGLLFWKNLGERSFYFENILLSEVEKDSLIFVGAQDNTLKIIRDSTGQKIRMQLYYRQEETNEYIFSPKE